MRKNARNLPGGDDHGHVDADLVVPIVEGNRAQRVQALDDDPKERPTDQGIVSTLRALSHSLDANQALRDGGDERGSNDRVALAILPFGLDTDRRGRPTDLCQRNPKGR